MKTKTWVVAGGLVIVVALLVVALAGRDSSGLNGKWETGWQEGRRYTASHDNIIIDFDNKSFSITCLSRAPEHIELNYVGRENEWGDNAISSKAELLEECYDEKLWKVPMARGTFTLTNDKIELTTEDGVKVLPFFRTENTINIDGKQFLRNDRDDAALKFRTAATERKERERAAEQEREEAEAQIAEQERKAAEDYAERMAIYERKKNQLIENNNESYRAARKGDLAELKELWAERLEIDKELKAAAASTEWSPGLPLDAGMNIRVWNGELMSRAAEHGHVEVMKWLKEQGVNVSLKYDIILAARGGSVEAMRWLAEQGADVTARGDDGRTLIFESASFGHVEAMKWLKEQGLDINAKNNGGSVPMHSAAMWGRVDAMKWLKEQGVDLDVKNNEGTTPMHLAAIYGEVDAVKWLKEQGADINAKTKDGKSPLQVARESDRNANNNMVEWLMENGAQ